MSATLRARADMASLGPNTYVCVGLSKQPDIRWKLYR